MATLLIDTALPPIRIDDPEALLEECMRLEADLCDLEEAGRRTEWLETQLIARVILLELATTST